MLVTEVHQLGSVCEMRTEMLMSRSKTVSLAELPFFCSSGCLCKMEMGVKGIFIRLDSLKPLTVQVPSFRRRDSACMQKTGGHGKLTASCKTIFYYFHIPKQKKKKNSAGMKGFSYIHVLHLILSYFKHNSFCELDSLFFLYLQPKED